MNKVIYGAIFVATITLGGCSASAIVAPNTKAVRTEGFYTQGDIQALKPNPSTKAIEATLSNAPTGIWSCHIEYTAIAGHSIAPEYVCNWWRN